jgi:hypothetical protein
MTREALEGFAAQMKGAPIYGPSEKPEQRPITVSSLAEQLSRVMMPGPTLRLDQIAVERFDGIDALGLGSDDAQYLERRLTQLSDGDRSALAATLFTAARSTLDRLTANASAHEPPTALWTPHGEPARVVGQTLLWADHYLVADATLEALLQVRDPGKLERLASPLAREARLRPLLETGVLALVPEQTAHVLVAEDAYASAEESLKTESLITWLMSELQVDGPSEREVIFISPRDSVGQEQVFFHAHIEGHDDEGDSLRVRSSMLHHSYDSGYDYGPWIEHTKRQAVAQHLQDMEFAIATARALGGHVLATTPFEGRLLARRGHPESPAGPLIWADIPSLPRADPATLARVAAEEETVEALRRTVRRGMAASEQTGGVAAAKELAEQLREDAAVLERAIKSERRWKLVAPAVLGVAGIALGAVTGPVGAAAAGLGALAGLAPLRSDHAARRQQAAYALYLADRRRER